MRSRNFGMLVYALRYALPRRSLAVDDVTSTIMDNVKDLGIDELNVIINEIRKCDNFGDNSCRLNWLGLAKYLEAVVHGLEQDTEIVE